MNNLLQLKGRFEQAPPPRGGGANNLPTGQSVNVSRLEGLLRNLYDLQEFWLNEDLLPGVLISVHYIKVAAKSNRLKYLLGKNSTTTPNDFIVGAKFSSDESPKHIITHYVSRGILRKSIEGLEYSINILNEQFNGEIDYLTIDKLNKKEISFTHQTIKKLQFLSLIIDAYFVERFGLSDSTDETINDAIITIYKTDVRTTELLERLGINILSNRIMDETTILLQPDELEILKTRAPFLISMAVTNLSEITRDDFEFFSDEALRINSPENEPTIGVIDTLFDDSVYFSEWVEYTNMLHADIPTSPRDFEHGTAVSSIIVDGPAFNPELEDGCGNFKVRHFGVASGKSFNSFTILRNISEIVAQNRDIKVWNLSLGSKLEIHPNFISPEAAVLDEIQSKYDVIFVIAGTNLSSDETEARPIGAPADSINSIVVNSVDINSEPSFKAMSALRVDDDDDINFSFCFEFEDVLYLL